MKKKISIAIIAFISMLSLVGCAIAQIEKTPVILSSIKGVQLKDTNLTNVPTQEAVIKQQEDKPTKEPAPTLPPEQEDNVTQDTFETAITIEGMQEIISATTHQSELGYRLTYDVDRFRLNKVDSKDIYMAENNNPELYPYVFLSVAIIDDLPPGKLSSTSLGKYDAFFTTDREGTKWNSRIVDTYYIAKDKQFFQLEFHYFTEAAEGYGARMNAMLESFEMMK